MQKKYLEQVIKKYAANTFPEEVQQKFRRWLINPEDAGAKEDILFDLWDNTAAEVDETTIEALKNIHKRINVKRPEHKTTFTQSWILKVAAVLLLPLVCSLVTFFITREVSSKQVDMVECFVPNGERRIVTLPDGSNVWLNSGSLLVYPESFGRTRSVFLSGEGNFTVERDEDSPFIVKTNYINVEVLGTVFNVKAYADFPRTIATLEEGSIRVDTKTEYPQSFILVPNEQLIYDHTSDMVSKRIVDASRVATWKEGYLVFQSASLNEVLHGVEKRFDVAIQYDSGKYEGRTFTIRFSKNENLIETLEILKEVVNGLDYKIKDKNIYIY